MALIIGFLPAMILSGFIFQISSMPIWLQFITNFIPATYFTTILQTLFLSGNIYEVIIPNTLWMLLIGIVLFAIILKSQKEVKLMFYQLLALIRKEFLAIWSDKRSRIVIISPPLIQLVLFSFAVTLEVKNISIGVLDRDNSNQSKEFIRSLKYSDRFSEVLYLKSNKDLQEKLDSQKIMVAIEISQEFSQKIQKGQKAEIGLIGDGRKSNSSQIAIGYIQMIIQS